MKSIMLTLIPLPTNDLISNLDNSLNQVVSAAQRLAPGVAAVVIIGAAFLYMYSDKFSDTAKTKMFKAFVAIGIIAGITTVVAWMSNTAKF